MRIRAFAKLDLATLGQVFKEAIKIVLHLRGTREKPSTTRAGSREIANRSNQTN